MANHMLQIATGDHYGDWTVVAMAHQKHEGQYWLCRCICGCERSIVGSRLVRGKSTNCGCRRWGRSGALTDEEHFWTRVGAEDENGCRPYLGGRTYGYGIHSWRGKTVRASRLAWTLSNGPIPLGMEVCHKCDNPPCCEPTHLFLGTTLINALDRDTKDRGPQGVRNPRAKLTVDEVREARSLYATGGFTIQELADRYGLSKAGMHQAIARKNWRNVD